MEKFNSLTSLRFFASLMVVTTHSVLVFFVPIYFPSDPMPFGFSVALSFFFILSGFILAYVYPRLNNWQEVKKFWVARFARIWPMHIFGILFLILLVPYKVFIPLNSEHNTFLIALANFFLVNSWIPIRTYILAYNSPAWSLCTEVFFYLLFPLLIFRFSKDWFLKLIISLAIAISMVCLINHFQKPSDVFIYTSPMTRLFEFVLGMATALAWQHFKLPTLNKWLATLLEVIILGLVIIGIAYLIHLRNHLPLWLFLIGDAGRTYFFFCAGLAPLFCLMIYFLASSASGYISRALNHPTLVLLGEMSFAIYLTHFTLMRLYDTRLHHLPIAPWISYIIYWILLLGISYYAHRYIEIPCRGFIIKAYAKRKSRIRVLLDNTTSNELASKQSE